MSSAINLSGGLATPPLTLNPVVQSSNFSASAGVLYLVDTTLSPVTITPPVAPTSAASFGVIDYGRSTAINPIVITFTPSKWYGQPDDLTINQNGAVLEFYYGNSSTGWVYGPVVNAGSSGLNTMVGATPTTHGVPGFPVTPAIGDETKFLRGDGTWAPVTGLSTMTGATSATPGISGAVPTPAAGDESKVLRGDGTWGNPNPSRLDLQVTQAAHGFLAGQALAHSAAGTYQLSTSAGTEMQSRFAGVVSAVTNANQFTLSLGTITGLPGVSAGQILYLSDVPGQFGATPPDFPTQSYRRIIGYSSSAGTGHFFSGEATPGGTTNTVMFFGGDGFQPTYHVDFTFNPVTKTLRVLNGSIDIDANFGIDFLTGEPRIRLDTNDSITYDRTNDELEIKIQGTTSLSLRQDLVHAVAKFQSGPAVPSGIPARFSGSFSYTTGGPVTYGTLTSSGASSTNATIGPLPFCAQFDNATLFSSGIHVVSDRRLKTHLGDLVDSACLNVVNSVPARSYSWSDGRADKNPKLGWFAQDFSSSNVHEVVTQVDYTTPDGTHFPDLNVLDEKQVLAVLWSAVRGLTAQNAELTTTLLNTTSELAVLTARLDSISKD